MDIITLNDKIADALEAEGVWNEELHLAEADRRIKVYKIYGVVLSGDEQQDDQNWSEILSYFRSHKPRLCGVESRANKEIAQRFMDIGNLALRPFWNFEGEETRLNRLEIQLLYAKQTGLASPTPTPNESPVSQPTSLNINQIRTDGGTQARAGLNEETVAEYLQAMKEGADFPPLIVFYDGQEYWLGDGFHRLEAMKRWGVFRTGPKNLDIRQGTQRDAVLFACGANATHGLKRSNEDKRRAVQRLLQDEEWARWADREIARRCNVSAPFVGQLREELGIVVEQRTYTTKHGTVATMAVAEKAPHPPQLKPGEILVPIDPEKPLNEGNYVIVSPPAGYVEFKPRGGYLSKCPNCGKGPNFTSTPLPGNSVGSNKNEWDITCGYCHTKMREVKVPRQRYYFHLPNSGKKPEVEIGGQEGKEIGGQGVEEVDVQKEGEEEWCPCGCKSESPERCSYALRCSDCGQQYYATEGHHCPDMDTKNKSFRALIYLEKIMQKETLVDVYGNGLHEIIEEVYANGESLLDVLLSLMGEKV